LTRWQLQQDEVQMAKGQVGYNRDTFDGNNAGVLVYNSGAALVRALNGWRDDLPPPERPQPQRTTHNADV